MKKTVKISQLQVNKDNPRAITEYMLDKLIESILIFSDMLAYRNIVISKEKVILGGNQRFLALKAISEMDFNEFTGRLLVLTGTLKCTPTSNLRYRTTGRNG
jgi:hypothetical protein